MDTLTRPHEVANAPAPVEREHGLLLLREMLRIRRFEEKCAEVYSLGKILGFLHLYIGEEAVAVGAMQALAPEDAIVATYREHGQALARGIPPGPIMAEMYGKTHGCSRGHGGSMHLFDVSRRFYGGNAIVAGGLPVAVGLALADRMQGQRRVTACFFGDGAVVEGEFHESMNLAALWKLPVLFICENNRYAMGTALERYQAQCDMQVRCQAYGVPSASVDGMDVLAVEAGVRQAVGQVRGGEGPFLLECRTYRFRAHSMADPDRYRTKEEIERWKQRDPILTFARQLREWGILSDSDYDQIEAEVAMEVQAAVEFAEASPLEACEDLLRNVCTPREP